MSYGNSNLQNSYEKSKSLLIQLLNDLNVTTVKVYQIDFLIMYFPFYMMVNDPDFKGKGIAFEFLHGFKDDDAVISRMLNADFESLPGDGTLHLAICEPVVFNHRGEEKTIESSDPNIKVTYISDADIFEGSDIGYNNAQNGINIDTDTAEENLKRDSNSSNCNKRMKDKQYNYKTFDHHSAVNGEIIKSTHIIHVPFINFPPLYAIATSNNPRINLIKKEYLVKKYGNLSRYDYWKHFSSNFSLLQKCDFRNLSACLYPKKSTTDWMIRVKNEFSFKSKSWVSKIEDEFEDVFHGHADVAFTVQPWAAVEKANNHHKKPFDIEIVYKSNTDEYDCTSVIFATQQAENMIIGNYILNLMTSVLDYNIKRLLKAERTDIGELLKPYCNMIKELCQSPDSRCNCRCCKCSENIEDDKSSTPCIDVNEVALEILADMNIYKRNISYFNENNRYKDIGELAVAYFYFIFEDQQTVSSMKKTVFNEIYIGESTDKIRDCFIAKYSSQIKASLPSKKISLSYKLSELLVKVGGSFNSILGQDGHDPSKNDAESNKNRENALLEFSELLHNYGYKEISDSIGFNKFTIEANRNEMYYKEFLSFEYDKHQSDFTFDATRSSTNETVSVVIKYCNAPDKTVIQNHIYVPHKIIFNFIKLRLDEIIKHEVADNTVSISYDTLQLRRSKHKDSLHLLVLNVLNSKSLDEEKDIVIPESAKHSLLFDYAVVAHHTDGRILISIPIAFSGQKGEWAEISQTSKRICLRGVFTSIFLNDKNEILIMPDDCDKPNSIKAIGIPKGQSCHVLVFDHFLMVK